MRRPIRSHVARRKMFQGGGLSSMGMTKPGASTASGILASSQPLVDVLAGQARDNLTNGINVGNQMYGTDNINVGNQMYGTDNINVGNQMYGSNVQGTNLMNQGGIANYSPGGISYTTNEAGDVVRIPVSGSKDEAEIVNKANVEGLPGGIEGLGMFSGMTEDQFKKSDAPGSAWGRRLQQGESYVQFAWAAYISKGGDASAPLILEDGTIIVGNPDGSGGQLHTKGRGSGEGIYEVPLVTGLNKENIGLIERPNVNIKGFAGDQDVVEKLDSEGQPMVTSEIIEEEKIPIAEVVTKMGEIRTSNEDLADMIKSDSTDTNVDLEKTFGPKEGDPYNFKDKDIYAAFGADAIKKDDDAKDATIKDKNIERIRDIVIEKDDPYDFTDKDLYDAFGAESVATVRKEATNGNEKEVAKTMEDYRKEFTKNMPAYKGMTQEEMGNAWIKMGLAIAGGESPNAIVNISKGVLATIDEFADDPKQKRDYETRIGLAASKYAIESVATDRVTEKTLETDFENYVVTEAGTITYPNGETIEVSPNQVVTVSTKDKLDGMDMSKLITTGMYDKDMDNIRALNTIAASTKSAMRNELVVGDKASRAIRADYVLNMDKVISGQELKVLISKSMDLNAEGKVTGLGALGRDALGKGFAAAGVDPRLFGMEEKDAVALLGRTAYNDQMQIVANSMLKTLLGEGSKNISNVDRQLAQEISGLVKGLAAGVFQNPELLNRKLQRIYNLIDKNQEAALGQVQSIAVEYSNRLVAGTDNFYYKTILEPIFAERETTFQTSRIPGSGTLKVGEIGTFSTGENGVIMYTMNKNEPES